VSLTHTQADDLMACLMELGLLGTGSEPASAVSSARSASLATPQPGVRARSTASPTQFDVAAMPLPPDLTLTACALYLLLRTLPDLSLHLVHMPAALTRLVQLVKRVLCDMMEQGPAQVPTDDLSTSSPLALLLGCLVAIMSQIVTRGVGLVLMPPAATSIVAMPAAQQRAYNATLAVSISASSSSWGGAEERGPVAIDALATGPAGQAVRLLAEVPEVLGVLGECVEGGRLALAMCCSTGSSGGPDACKQDLEAIKHAEQSIPQLLTDQALHDCLQDMRCNAMVG
ncbi:hypothetical protein HaLaN_29304, partial [Haematococcus lacustris]